MKAIFKREFKSYFHTMAGPVVIAAIMLFMGIYFTVYNIIQGYPYFSPVLSSLSVVLLFVVPVLTMKSFAEERRSKTDQLLLTSPLSVTQIVLGKYFAMTAVPALCMVPACLAPVIVMLYGGGAAAADYASILCFLLLTGAYIAIGMFISSTTESQVLAAVGTFCTLLLLQLIDGIGSMIPSSSAVSAVCFALCVLAAAAMLYNLTKNLIIGAAAGGAGILVIIIVYIVKSSLFEGLFGKFISAFSMVSRFDAIVNQSLDISTVIYYISAAAVFVFLTVQSVQKRRWS